MNAVAELRRGPLAVQESRDFRSYHQFLRAARNFMEGPLVASMHRAYEEAVESRQKDGLTRPQTAREAEPLLDGVPQFQLYSWLYRNLQRFKYHRGNLGILPTVEAQRERLVAQLDEAAAEAGDRLRLDPSLAIPEYFRMVDFHQHTGGVAADELAGIVYELARRTTVPQHADPSGIYRMVFDELPKDRAWRRVLDWGTGHGAGILEWQRLHPESECHGVDLSAPCLRLAHLRARERGVRIGFSQQDLEHLDFASDSFDLVFFNFMLHELPPGHFPALFREACRVLAPGGVFAGAEFHLRPGDPFQNVLQRSHAWLNNETYSCSWYAIPIEEVARAAGFSAVVIRPFERLIGSIPKAGRNSPAAGYWNYYEFRK